MLKSSLATGLNRALEWIYVEAPTMNLEGAITWKILGLYVHLYKLVDAIEGVGVNFAYLKNPSHLLA